MNELKLEESSCYLNVIGASFVMATDFSNE